MGFVLASKASGDYFKVCFGNWKRCFKEDKAFVKNALTDVNVYIDKIFSGILMFFKNAMRMGVI